MIISASRRTDIPAFYSKWFINRIRLGYCTVPNPYNKNQVTYISLKPDDVDFIVFWTRNPRPLFPFINELDNLGYKYYFQFTLMNNPSCFEHKTPNLLYSIKNFKQISDMMGPEKVIWRYDPIIYSNITDIKFHSDSYKMISKNLKGYTYRSVISILDLYKKITKRLKLLKEQNVEITDFSEGEKDNYYFEELMCTLAQIASENNMEIVSCSETFNLEKYGIKKGKCIDNNYIKENFNINVSNKKDASQREACGCVESKDIGVYNTCLFGCQYCYATSNFTQAKIKFRKHKIDSPALYSEDNK